MSWHCNVQDIKKGFDKRGLFISGVLAVIVLYAFNPFLNNEPVYFDRSICPAVIRGVSIDHRINSVYCFFLICIPLIFGIASIYGCFFLYNRSKYKLFFVRVCCIYLLSLMVMHASKYINNLFDIKSEKLYIAILIGVVCTIIQSIIDINERLDEKKITFTHVSCFSIQVLVNYFFDGWIYIIMSLLLCTIVSTAAIFSLNKGVERLYYSILCVIMWESAIVSILIEFMYILNYRGIYLQSWFYFFVLIITAVFFTAFYMVKAEIMCGYIGVIISFGLISFFNHAYQVVVNFGDYNNIFELSNMSIAKDSISGKQIPIVDYFSAHAVSDVFTRIIYMITNADLKGGLGDVYGGIIGIISMLIIFFIIRELFSDESAILFCIFFPLNVGRIKTTSICFVTVLVLIILIKKNYPMTRIILYWIITLVSALFIYDEGISLGVASVVTIIIFELLDRNMKSIARFFSGNVICAVFFLSVYIIYSFINNIRPFMRIKEWIDLGVASNSTWAMESIGDLSLIGVQIAYFFAPLCAIVILFMTILLYVKEKKAKVELEVTATFAIAELLYLSRGLVFHSFYVCQGRTGVLMNFFHLTVAFGGLMMCLHLHFSDEKRFFIWSLLMMVAMYIEGGFVLGQEYLPTKDSIMMSQVLCKEEDIIILDNNDNIMGQERIVYDDELNRFIYQFESIFDAVLKEDESFLDFANITALYQMTDRERPFYIAQSPSLLTNLESQKFYLDELKTHKLPLAIIGENVDGPIQSMSGIPHNIRYYKVAEYLYSKYRPIVMVGDFTIWCEKEKYLEFKEILENKGYHIIDYGYDRVDTCVDTGGEITKIYSINHSADLGLLPYIWANYDVFEASNGEKIYNLCSDGKNKFSFEGSQKIKMLEGTYIACIIENLEDQQEAKVCFKDSMNEGVEFEYRFTIKKGVNNYLIRVSNDYFWSAYNIDSVVFTCENNIDMNVSETYIVIEPDIEIIK